MPIIERIKNLNLPDGQFVVIGSGVMDALGLREANDLDLVVSSEYFDELKASGKWNVGQKNGEEVLTLADVEVWQSWGSLDGQPNFLELYEGGIIVDGIRFANPEFVRDWKIKAGRPKDNLDVALLSEYLDDEPSAQPL